MTRTFKLNHAIADNVTTEPEDVLAAKHFLHDMGFYQPPEWGMTPYPDHTLIDSIRDFQAFNGLRVDGVMKPGGETEETIRQAHSVARRLQGLGRHGDTLLAHITPAEARMLKAQGGAGTRNPATGLLEFNKTGNDSEKKEGEYIWHTVGDGKVRSSHADRDGKIFSWNDPPDGGHPGEDYNCRCWAEDVLDKNATCKKLREKINRAKLEVDAFKQEAETLRKNLLQREREFIQREDELIALLVTLGLSDLDPGGANFLERAKWLLSRWNLGKRIADVKNAWDRRNKADGVRLIAREILEDGRKRLKAAEEVLSKLRREHEEKCP